VADVFISYRREDRPVAENIARALNAYDLEVVWDHDWDGGDAAVEARQRDLDKACAVVALWSPAPPPLVIDDAARAQKRGALVSVALDDAQAPADFSQALRLRHWDGAATDAQVRAIADACVKAAPPSPDGKIKTLHFAQLSLWSSVAISAALGVAGGVAIGFEELAHSDPAKGTATFWLLRAVAGIVMIGAVLLVSRWLFAGAQALAKSRARGFFDRAFCALCAFAVLGGLAGGVMMDMGARPIFIVVTMSAISALSLAIAALPVAFVIGRLRSR
jgi:hypothetical protein